MRALQAIRRLISRFDIRALIAVVLALRIMAIQYPRNALVFDEAYYVPAARDMLNGVASNLEHPFLGKLIGALGILAFGDNWMGWRIPIVICSTLALYVFYLLAKNLIGERRALYASALLGFENIFFIHGELLLLDVPSLLFVLVGFHSYLKGRYTLGAVAFGLAILCKETALLFVLPLLMYHLVAHRDEVASVVRRNGVPRGVMTAGAFKFAKVAVVVFLVVMTPMWAYDLAYRPTAQFVFAGPSNPNATETSGASTAMTSTSPSVETVNITNPFIHWQYILNYASRITTSNGSDSGNYAWNWILPPPYRPLVYYEITVNRTVDETVSGQDVQTENVVTHPISWVGMGNLVIWYSIWLVVPLLTYQVWKRKTTPAGVFSLAWIAGTYLPLLYLSAVAHRVVYPFYFLPTIPGLCLGISLLIGEIRQSRTKVLVAISYLLLVLAFFTYYFPVRVLDFLG